MFKKGFTYSIVILFFGSLVVIPTTGNIVFYQTSRTPFEINTIDEDTIELTISPEDFAFSRTNTKKGEFTTLSLPGEGFTNSIGDARLPVIRRILEIPYGANPKATVTSVSWKKISLGEKDLPKRIIPVQPPVTKISADLKELKLSINDEYYAADDFINDDIVKIEETGEIREHRVILVEVNPVQYNPSQGTLRLMKSCDIRIDLPGGNIDLTSERNARYSSPAFDKMLSALIDNYGSVTVSKSGLQNNQEGYLIIVHDSFYEEILPLANWKQNRGSNVTVTKTSDIPGGPSKANIKAYIETAYNNWTVPPTYVLLVGDTLQIPAFNGEDTGSATDLYYVTVSPSDYLPDIFIGRFPASLESHVVTMVNKTIAYEQGVFPSADWINKSAFMASNDSFLVTESTHDYVIDNYLIPNSYTCDRLYCHTFSATTQQVTDALNDGRGIVVFSGHGSSVSWLDGPAFTQSNVSSLNNEDMYPFVCSFACLTGKFSRSECFGETWLRSADKGGLAFWGSSFYTFWEEDEILEKNTFSAWWDDNIDTIGGITDMGLYYTYVHYGGGRPQ